MPKAVGENEKRQRHALRDTLRVRRAALTERERRQAEVRVCAQLAALRPFRAATTVALYAAVAGEIDAGLLVPLLAERGTAVAYPRVLSVAPPRLGFFALARGESLTPDHFGIGAPPADAAQVSLGSQAVVLVPGIAFSRTGHRLGHGHGYYDAALSEVPAAVRIGLCHDFQLVDLLPPPHPGDQPVDFIITPRERVVTGARPLAPEEVLT